MRGMALCGALIVGSTVMLARRPISGMVALRVVAAVAGAGAGGNSSVLSVDIM
jgi:hypothetical protein